MIVSEPIQALAWESYQAILCSTMCFAMGLLPDNWILCVPASHIGWLVTVVLFHISIPGGYKGGAFTAKKEIWNIYWSGRRWRGWKRRPNNTITHAADWKAYQSHGACCIRGGTAQMLNLLFWKANCWIFMTNLQAWESSPFDQVCTIGVTSLWIMYPSVVQYLFGLIRCRQIDAVSGSKKP